MAVTIVIPDPGGENFDAYSTLALADTYFVARVNVANWTAATNDEKGIALVSATRMLDRQAWAGTRTAAAPGQPLEWPRTGAVDENGDAIGSTVTPTNVITANQELALSLLNDASIQDSSSSGRSVKSLRTGNVDVEFVGGGQSVGSSLPQIVAELVEPLLRVAVVGVASGTGEVSAFDSDADRSELSEGYQ